MLCRQGFLPSPSKPAAIASMKALVPDLAMVPKLLISSSATAAAIKLLAPSCKLIKTYGYRTSQIGNDLHIRQRLGNTTSHGKDHSWSCQSQSPAKQFSPGKTGQISAGSLIFRGNVGQGSIHLWPTVGNTSTIPCGNSE